MVKYDKVGFLFDLDGVLIDSESEYTKIWQQVNREFPSGVENLETVIKGCTLEKILAEYYPDPEMGKKVTERLYELEGRMKYDWKPGAKALLEKLRESGIPAALVTSSNDDKMKHLDEEIPYLRDYFKHIVTADQITHSKPHPEGYLLGADKIGRDINHCAVVEDSLQGVKAGKASGAFVIGNAGTLPEDVIRPYSDITVASLEELDLQTLLKQLENGK